MTGVDLGKNWPIQNYGHSNILFLFLIFFYIFVKKEMDGEGEGWESAGKRR